MQLQMEKKELKRKRTELISAIFLRIGSKYPYIFHKMEIVGMNKADIDTMRMCYSKCRRGRCEAGEWFLNQIVN